MLEWTLPWRGDWCVRFVLPAEIGTEELRRELEAELGAADQIGPLRARLEWLAFYRNMRLRRLPDWSTGPYGETVVRFGLEPLANPGRPAPPGSLHRVPSQPHRA